MNEFLLQSVKDPGTTNRIAACKIRPKNDPEAQYAKILLGNNPTS